MPNPTFRDRFYTPQVARALTSPLGILLAAGGLAVGIGIGFPFAAAIAMGAAAYGVRVAAAIPKDNSFDGINPFSLEDPWRTFVWQAKRSQRQFADSVKHTREGPLRDRLREIADRIDTGVDECWHVAQTGQQLTEARARIDIDTIQRDLGQLPTGDALQANPALAETARALQAQLDTASRMDEIIVTTRDRLRLLDARLGELVTRVLELSVRPQGLDDLAAIGADVDTVVAEMESLRQALDETDRTSAAPAGSVLDPATPMSMGGPAAPASPSLPAATPATPQAAPAPQVTAAAPPAAPIPHQATPQPVAPQPQTYPPSSTPPPAPPGTA